MSSNLERAVSLAAWLIRTGKQPPAQAIQIGARKFGVDRHAVAQRVGARGGRRAAETRRRAAFFSLTQQSAIPSESVLTILMLKVEPCESGVNFEGRLLDGPRANHELRFHCPTGMRLAANAGDRVRFATSYPSGANDPPQVTLHRVLGVEPTAARGPS